VPRPRLNYGFLGVQASVGTVILDSLGLMVTLVSRQLLPTRMMLVALEGRSDASLTL
jgi:hypothetical protein